MVITLVAQTRAQRASRTTLSAFATPTVVHFAGAFLVSAVMSTPWPTLAAAGIARGVGGSGGVGYVVRVVLRARRQTDYKPQREDWVWHAALPGAAYVALAVGAYLVGRDSRVGMFIAGATALSLLFIGIHNAWDTVTYLVATADAPGEDAATESQRAPRESGR